MYENNQLQFFSQEEGRIRPSLAPGERTKFLYDYFLKDHLGNVKMRSTDEQVKDEYMPATVETDKVEEQKKIYDIKDGQIEDLPQPVKDDHPSLANRAYRVRNVDGERTGVGVTLKVMAGDEVSFHAESYYTPPTTGNTAGNTGSVILSQLLGAFTGSAALSSKPGLTVSDLVSNTDIANPLSSFLNDPSRNTSPNIPKASLNYILLDDQLKKVGGDFDPVNAAADGYTNHTKFTNGVSVTKNGYVYIYVSNESDLKVLFDNLVVTHTHGPLLEETHYYPFGLTMQGISSKAAGFSTNKLKYNGNEEQRQEFSDGSGLELYDFNARNYDAQIARFHQIDPMSSEGGQETWSPYHSCFNNPILRNDPTGMFSPIYNQNGEFLGTDDQGLQGKGIVMDESKFEQGMKHEDAMVNSLGAEGLNDKDAEIRLINHWNGLKIRPDYDGVVTVQEGVSWAKEHPNLGLNKTTQIYEKATASDNLYLDASKMDFGYLSNKDFENGIGKVSNINLFNLNLVDFMSDNSRYTTYALGRTKMTLLNANGSVKVENGTWNNYDWDNGGNPLRQVLIRAERIIKNLRC